MILKRLIKDSDNRTLTENIFSLSTIEFINKIIPLITYPYLTRILGPSVFGVYVFALAIIGYFKLFIDFGFDLSATKKIAENKFKLFLNNPNHPSFRVRIIENTREWEFPHYEYSITMGYRATCLGMGIHTFGYLLELTMNLTSCIKREVKSRRDDTLCHE